MARQITTLKECMRKAKGDQAKMNACETAFKAAGGTVTADGGKVFSAPDNSEGFVTTGGKVF
jgi:hypothetical protein